MRHQFLRRCHGHIHHNILRHTPVCTGTALSPTSVRHKSQFSPFKRERGKQQQQQQQGQQQKMTAPDASATTDTAINANDAKSETTTAGAAAAGVAVDASDGGEQQQQEQQQQKRQRFGFLQLPQFDENDRYGDGNEEERKEYNQWLESFAPLKMIRDALNRQKDRIRYDLRNTPMAEIRRLAAANDKLFIASDQMMPANNAIDFPSSYRLLKTVQSVATLAADGTTRHFTDVRAEMTRRKATLLFVSFVALAAEDAKLWLDPFAEKYAGNKHVNFYDMSVSEGLAYKLVQSVLSNNIVQQTPRDRYENRLVWYAAPEESYKFKTHLGIENSKTSYLFLCDGRGRVRWTASGKPLEQELETLYKLTNELIATAR